MTSRTIFKHTELNRTGGAIRLLKVLPNLSLDGLVECELWQDTSDASYTCLSYVWGNENDEREILVNGDLFRCRSNLWSFLDVARIKYADPPDTFWIDAICIDQKNVSERNRQVAKMGEIYSSAAGVLIWLGPSESIARFLTLFSTLVAQLSMTKRNEKYMRTFWYEQRSPQANADWLSFRANTYWSRAWITQEVFLAKEVHMLAERVVIGRIEFKAIIGLFPTLSSIIPKVAERTDNIRTTLMIEMYLRDMAGYETNYNRRTGTTVERRLVDLVHFLRDRECQIPRDRIYSLKSIARDGDCIRVDYGASDAKCLLQSTKALHKSMCFCSLASIARLLDYTTLNVMEHSVRLPTIKLRQLVSTVEKFGPSQFTRSRAVQQAWSPRPNRFGEDGMAGCAHCSEHVDVGINEEHLICLGRQCTEKSYAHLIIRKDSSELRIITSAGQQRTTQPVGLRIRECKGNRIDRVAGRTGIVEISMDLDAWIFISLFTAGTDGKLCQQTRPDGHSSVPIFSHPLSKMRVT